MQLGLLCKIVFYNICTYIVGSALFLLYEHNVLNIKTDAHSYIDNIAVCQTVIIERGILALYSSNICYYNTSVWVCVFVFGVISAIAIDYLLLENDDDII